jgi:microcompartment protein CcmK/EutM
MKRPPHLLRCLAAACLVGLGILPARADQHVAVNSMAKAEYTQRKFVNGKPRLETYVFMQGKYFSGTTADRSIDRMSFRQIAEFLAPELARQQYLPTKDPAAADLLLVVHWGTTVPRVTSDEMRGIATIDLDKTVEKKLEGEVAAAMVGAETGLAALVNAGSEADRQTGYEQAQRITDGLDNDLQAGTNAQLLGYNRELRKLQESIFSGTTEATLRSDLAGERYFIIIKAYDLKEKRAVADQRKPVWTIFLNIRSPGHNFPTALGLMGNVAVNFLGRTTDGVQTAQPGVRTGTVSLGELVIIGEVK